MIKRLQPLIKETLNVMESLNGHSCYYSEQVPDLRYKNYKYFFKFNNTHSVCECFRTQREMESFCNEYLNSCK